MREYRNCEFATISYIVPVGQLAGVFAVIILLRVITKYVLVSEVLIYTA